MIGRPVLYHPHTQPARRDDGAQPLAALIVRVHADDRVNLVAFDQNGVTSGEKDVLLWGGKGDRPTVDYAEWPDAKPVEPPTDDDQPASNDPKQASDEDDATYRRRVKRWRKEEQARVAAENAAEQS